MKIKMKKNWFHGPDHKQKGGLQKWHEKQKKNFSYFTLN